MTIATGLYSKFYIGTQKVCAAAADYSSDTWTEIGNVKEIDKIGDTTSEVKVENLGSGRVGYLPGPRDGGSTTVTCNYDGSDVGQLAFQAAHDANSPINFNFKIVDADGTASGTGTTLFFSGLPLEAPFGSRTSSEVRSMAFKIAVNTRPLIVAAS